MDLLKFLLQTNKRPVPPAKDNMQHFICTKSKTFRNVFIYKNDDTFRKAIKYVLHFYIYKIQTLYNTRFFMKMLKLESIYKKPWQFCITRHFYIQKARHFVKIKTIWIRFLYTRSLTLCITQFCMEFLKLAEGGSSLYAKNNAFCVTFLYKKIQTLCVIFLYTKQCTFALRFYI